jgi:glycosyltransferase involved in cell wall biosynthesis
MDHTAQMSGGEIALLNLVNEIDRRRFEPIVLLFSPGPLADRLLACGVETYTVPLASAVLNTRKDSLGARSLTKIFAIVTLAFYTCKLCLIVSKLRVQLIHTNSLKADVIGGLVGRILRIPVMWHVRDTISDAYLPKTVARWFRAMSRVLPNFVIANSQATMNSLHAGAAEKELTSRGNEFVVWDGTPIGKRGQVSFRSNSDGQQKIALIGRISPWKGQDVFVKAANLLHARFPQAKFLIVGKAMFGEHEYERMLHQLIEQNGLAQNVIFTGFTDDVPGLIDQVDVVVHASTIPEPFGQVVIEAMAAGKPVVATRGGGVNEIIVDGDSGILVAPGDPVALAEAIAKLLESEPRRREIAEKGYQRVADNFSIKHTADKIQSIYSSVLSR